MGTHTRSIVCYFSFRSLWCTRGENVYYVSTGQAAGQPMTIQDLPETGLTWEPLNAAEAAKDSSPSGKVHAQARVTVRER